MLDYRRRPLLFKSFTGLEITEFDTISREIESKYDEHERKRLSKKEERKEILELVDHSN